ncbi:MAG: DNA-binding response regulator [Alphaproteobacteria bacterium]|nr:MAG: DNA-binding response regulator [Alphaproteobacteria bacterium]
MPFSAPRWRAWKLWRAVAVTAANHVHIIDDDPRYCRAVELVLSNAGYAVAASTDGGQFLQEDTPRDGCILLDLEMPQMSGLQLFEVLLKRPAPPHVIFVTGHADVDVAVQLIKMGALDVIQKPFQPDRLLNAVQASFESAPAPVESERAIQAKAQIAKLSPRERELLQGLVGGMSNKSLAGAMRRSVRTIEMHRARMMDRLGVRTLADALQIAFVADFTAENAAPVGARDGARNDNIKAGARSAQRPANGSG